MTFISAAILGVALLASPQASDQRAEAERLAKTGAYAQALKGFQALAAANPDDIEARLWIARLHALMGHPGQAADVYQSVAATEPRNVDALIGLGNALTTAGRFREAGDALNRAEALAADRPALLVAQGRLHREAGHPNLSLAYYQRALAIEPGNADAQAAVQSLTAERAHRIEGTYDFEHFDPDTPDTHAVEIAGNFRVGEGLRLSVAGQHVSKFDLDENRGGAGIEWRAQRNLHITAGGLFASDTEVIPDADFGAGLRFAQHRVSWLANFRYLNFSTSSTLVWSPGVTIAFNERVLATARYYHSRSDFDELLGDFGNDSVSLDVAGRLGRQFWLQAGYSNGFEALALITAERLEQFDAHNLSVGGRFDVSPRTSFGVTYQHQQRDNDVNVNAATVKFVQRF